MAINVVIAGETHQVPTTSQDDRDRWGEFGTDLFLALVKGVNNSVLKNTGQSGVPQVVLGQVSFSGKVNLSEAVISRTPTDNNDVVKKEYVDNAVSLLQSDFTLPIGTIIAVHLNTPASALAGDFAVLWRECNGMGTLPAAFGVDAMGMPNVPIPNLNDDTFLAGVVPGATLPALTGGLNDQTLVLNNLPDHMHENDHRHTPYASATEEYETGDTPPNRSMYTRHGGEHSHRVLLNADDDRGTNAVAGRDGDMNGSYDETANSEPDHGSRKHIEEGGRHNHELIGHTSNPVTAVLDTSVNPSVHRYTHKPLTGGVDSLTQETFDNRPKFFRVRYFIKVISTTQGVNP